MTTALEQDSISVRRLSMQAYNLLEQLQMQDLLTFFIPVGRLIQM
jgi:hypothetical protein